MDNNVIVVIPEKDTPDTPSGTYILTDESGRPMYGYPVN